MKNIGLLLLLSLSLNCFGQIEKLFPAKPSPIKLLNDYTATLTESEANSLEDKLMAFRKATTNEIAVVVLPTINEYAIEDVSLGIFRKWHIGLKGKNNGALLLVIKNDHKLRIETGYGLEGSLPDTKCAEIIRNDIKPAFKNGDFYKGLDDGTTEMIKAVEPEYGNNLPDTGKENDTSASSLSNTPQAVEATNGNSNSYEQSSSTNDDNTEGRFWWIIPALMFGAFVFIVIKFGGGGGGTTNSSDNDDSYSSSSSSSDSDSGSSDFGGGDSGGGGSSDSW